jgi:hypothetical protein
VRASAQAWLLTNNFLRPRAFLAWLWGGELILDRAPALLRRSVCAFRVPRPKSRLPEKVGTPMRKAARVVRGGARPPPQAHRRRRTGRGCAPRALGVRQRAVGPLGQRRRRCTVGFANDLADLRFTNDFFSSDEVRSLGPLPWKIPHPAAAMSFRWPGDCKKLLCLSCAKPSSSFPSCMLVVSASERTRMT